MPAAAVIMPTQGTYCITEALPHRPHVEPPIGRPS